MSMGQDESLLDPMTLLAGCGGDAGLLQTMIRSFQSHVPKQLAALREAAERGDEDAFWRVAHQLRGLVLAFSKSVSENFAILEQIPIPQQSDLALGQCAVAAQLIHALSRALSTVSIESLEHLADMNSTPYENPERR